MYPCARRAVPTRRLSVACDCEDVLSGRVAKENCRRSVAVAFDVQQLRTALDERPDVAEKPVLAAWDKAAGFEIYGDKACAAVRTGRRLSVVRKTEIPSGERPAAVLQRTEHRVGPPPLRAVCRVQRRPHLRVVERDARMSVVEFAHPRGIGSVRMPCHAADGRAGLGVGELPRYAVRRAPVVVVPDPDAGAESPGAELI